MEPAIEESPNFQPSARRALAAIRERAKATQPGGQDATARELEPAGEGDEQKSRNHYRTDPLPGLGTRPMRRPAAGRGT